MATTRKDNHRLQLDDAVATLRRRHLRVTSPRKATLAVLIGEHGPFSTEEIHQRMKKRSCDLVTVYRCLTALEKVGLVRRCDFGDGTYRYEFDPGESHHHHIVCRSCGKVETIDLCFAEDLERQARQKGFTDITHAMELFGICSKCRKSKAG